MKNKKKRPTIVYISAFLFNRIVMIYGLEYLKPQKAKMLISYAWSHQNGQQRTFFEENIVYKFI